MTVMVPTCFHHSCDAAVDVVTLKATIGPRLHSRLLRWLQASMVDCSPQLGHCPNEACGLLHRRSTRCPGHVTVTCRGCETSFCWSCRAPPHWPLRCRDQARLAAASVTIPPALLISAQSGPAPSSKKAKRF